MKLTFTKKAYDGLNVESQRTLEAVPCDCLVDGKPKPDCEDCEGGGQLWEAPISAEDQAAIQENFRRQGVPLGKAGTQ